MQNFLCETNNIVWTIAFAVLIVLMIVYLILGSINRRKSQEQAMKMIAELKVGDKVVTNAGIYGEIVSQRETNMGRVVTLKTGEDGKFGYITVNSSVILGIDEKQDILTDEQGNIIEPEVAKENVLKGMEEEPKAEEKVEGKAEEKTEEPKKEKKATGKKATKKTNKEEK